MNTVINKGADMSNNTPKYQSTLIDLVKLRYADYDAFMERLYEALHGEHKDAINDATPAENKKQALETMIQYFSDKEEYEKCAELHLLMSRL
jgi:hypothetical protein